MRLVLASNNHHKLVEMRQLLEPLGVDLVTQGSLGIPEAQEPHVTFVENALAKARHASAASGLPAIADDSGLCVDALGGAPGVLSARYATLFGHEKSDANNNIALLQQLQRLQGKTSRRAGFVCALVAVRHQADPEPLIAFGRWDGEILDTPRGQGGFGYDPLMFIPGLSSSVAELSPRLKNEHSHRALAMRQMLGLMRDAWMPGAGSTLA